MRRTEIHDSANESAKQVCEICQTEQYGKIKEFEVIDGCIPSQLQVTRQHKVHLSPRYQTSGTSQEKAECHQFIVDQLTRLFNERGKRTVKEIAFCEGRPSHIFIEKDIDINLDK